MPNPFLYRDTTDNGVIPGGDRPVLAFVTGAERRDSIWLNSTLATADSYGNKFYEKGQVLTKVPGGVNSWSYPATASLSTAYSAGAQTCGVLVARVNVGFGDAEGALYTGFSDFDVAGLRGYVGNEADVRKQMPTCRFLTVSQQS